jgi:ribonuclease-3
MGILNKLKSLFSLKVKSEQSLKGKISKLESLIGAPINDSNVFIEAITHQSVLNQSKSLDKSNQRLEFLGDAILGAIVAEYLFQHYPDLNEGDLTKFRVRLVDKNALYKTALHLNMQDIVLYDKRFIKDNETGLKSILADAMEALIGAIYLDQGLLKTKEFIEDKIIDFIDYSIDSNYKGQLLELSHKNGKGNPVYELVNVKGPEHDKIFTVAVSVGNVKLGVGSGRNKKTAEQNAAEEALKRIKNGDEEVFL